MNIIIQKYKSILFALVVFAIGVLGSTASAQSLDSIVFPVSDLGNCESEEACRIYCDDLNNIDACVTFAEQHGLMEEHEVVEAKKLVRAGGHGPGGCTSRAECESFCDDVRNIEQCIVFAEEHDFLDRRDVADARKIARALERGAVLPGNCRTKNECEAYCESEGNIEQCIAFAEAAGFIPPEEVAGARKAMQLMRSGQSPGNCRGHRECEAYCEDPAHIEACVAFGLEAGFVTHEEAEIVRKTGGVGPGGCRGAQECELFCNQESNAEVCFAFAQEHGFLSENDVRDIEKNTRQLREGLAEAPSEVRTCIEGILGVRSVEKIKNGTFTPTHKSGDGIRRCFEEHSGVQQEAVEAFENTPPEVRACIERELGGVIVRGLRKGDVKTVHDHSDRIKKAFEGCYEREQGRSNTTLNDFERAGERKDLFIENLTPEIRECMVSVFGDEYNTKIKSIDISGEQARVQIEQCLGGVPVQEGFGTGDIEHAPYQQNQKINEERIESDEFFEGNKSPYTNDRETKSFERTSDFFEKDFSEFGSLKEETHIDSFFEEDRLNKEDFFEKQLSEEEKLFFEGNNSEGKSFLDETHTRFDSAGEFNEPAQDHATEERFIFEEAFETIEQEFIQEEHNDQLPAEAFVGRVAQMLRGFLF